MTDHIHRESPPSVIDGNGLLPPPDELKQLDLPLVDIDLRTHAVYRCHGHKYPAYAYNHSRADTRFAAPDGEFGVLYFAFDEYGAFIETFGPDILMAKYRVLSHTTLDNRCICQFNVEQSTRPFRVVDLTQGSSLTKLNLDGRISTIKDREITRQWSLAFWSHQQEPDGILYVSCNDPGKKALVVFDRAGSVFHSTCDQKNFLADAATRDQLLNTYHIIGLPDADITSEY